VQSDSFEWDDVKAAINLAKHGTMLAEGRAPAPRTE